MILKAQPPPNAQKRSFARLESGQLINQQTIMNVIESYLTKTLLEDCRLAVRKYNQPTNQTTMTTPNDPKGAIGATKTPMEYEDYKQLSDAIKDIEETVFCSMEGLTSASPLKYAQLLTKSRKHLTKMKHILDRQLHFEHAPPEPWSSHDLFF